MKTVDPITIPELPSISPRPEAGAANEARERASFLPFCVPDIGEGEIAEVVLTLKSGWITTGPRTMEFERLFAQYVGSRHAIAVSSCTAALHIAARGDRHWPR